MKKAPKTFLISLAVAALSFIICLIYAQFGIQLPDLIRTSVNRYKFYTALKFFCMFLPAVFATSVTLSWCIEYGQHPENSRRRFSDAMFTRYRNVVITSLVMILVISCVSEIALPVIVSKIKAEEKLTVLMKEYQHTARNLYKSEKYELAYQYAKLAYEIEPDNKTNKELMYITEIYYNKEAEVSQNVIEKINSLTFNDTTFGRPKPAKSPAQTPYKTYELLITARNCFAERDWFGAHYYSQLGLSSCDSKDINQTELKQIAAASWNQLNQSRFAGTTEEQKLFAKKYEGYVNLVNGDFLRAYYIFHALSLQSKKMSIDPDVKRYLEIAEESLQKMYFFTDETKDLQGYESARDVYFKLTDPAARTTTIYFIRGITTTGSGSNMIQYLRGLEIIILDSVGIYRSGYYIPYAKVTCLQTDNFDSETQELLGIDKSISSVPFIMLNSVDRNYPDSMILPEYKGGYSFEKADEYVILKMPFEDFDQIKQASNGIDSMNLISLFSFARKADTYGYSTEAFGHALMDRLLKPIYHLILFIIIGIVSWHFRLEENSIFKFKWIIVIPFLTLMYTLLFQLATCFYKFINYGVFAVAGKTDYIAIASVIYVLILIVCSLTFLACRNGDGK